MSLPTDTGVFGTVLSFAGPKAPEVEVNHREVFDRLNAQAEPARRFIGALELLSDCGRSPRDEAETMDALDHALSCVIEVTSASDGALLVLERSSGDLVFALVHGETPKNKLLWRRVPAGRGVAQWSVRHRRAAIVNNVLNDERFYSGIDAANGFRTRSIVAAPLIHDDEVIGVIEVLNKKNGEFFCLSDQNHLTILARLASELLVTMRNRQAG